MARIPSPRSGWTALIVKVWVVLFAIVCFVANLLLILDHLPH